MPALNSASQQSLLEDIRTSPCNRLSSSCRALGLVHHTRTTACSALVPGSEYTAERGMLLRRRSLAYEAPSPDVLRALTVLVRHTTVAGGDAGGATSASAAQVPTLVVASARGVF